MNTTQNQATLDLAPSAAIALDNIWLRPTSRWGHTEYSFEYHKEYLARHTGLSDDARTGCARAWTGSPSTLSGTRTMG
ncbi:MAG: hypothetical protein IPM07_18570 [Anaerolineales bacterium]|nr:hypothetical protein [Anaerolineales bacterium]